MVRRAAVFVVVAALLAGAAASAQVIMRPGPGAKPGGVTVIEPTFEPPYRLTITVYASGADGRPLPGLVGANVLVIDPQGRRVGIDDGGTAVAEVPKAVWGPALNTQPNAPIGPRGLSGSGITLNDPVDGHYVLEIAGTDRALLDLAVAQWDRAGRRRWLHLARASTEPGAIDRWDIPYTGAARPPFDLLERRDDSYLSVRAYGHRGAAAAEEVVAELLLTDARGRRVGREPKSGRDYHEVPRASYDSGTGDAEGRELEVGRPATGPYTLDVIGTTSGRYDVTIYMTDAGGQSVPPIELSDVPTRAGVVHRYRLDPAAAPATAAVSGAWAQGARLLSYACPTSARSELAAGDTTVTLIVFYAPSIAPATFRATLGGRDVSARFKPAPGGWQAIRLPVAPGSNTLVLSVSGAMPDGRTLSQTDALEVVRRR